MPKPKYDHSTFSIKNLLAEVSEKATINIASFNDCQALSIKLMESGIHISDHTLARLYKIVATRSIPYKYTLDKLSGYIGYQNWDDFFYKFKEEHNDNPVLYDTASERISDNELLLLKYCIEDNAFNPVFNYLNKITESVYNPYSKDSHKVANQIGYAIRNNAKAQTTLIPFITRNEIMREMFYTWWVDIDGLNLYFADYIKNLYLKHLHPNDINFSQNEIWAFCMLMYNELYANNFRKFSHYAYYLFKKYEAKDFILEGRSNFYPFARFHATHIIYMNSIKGIGNKWNEEKIDYILKHLSIVNDQFKIVIISHIIEALVLSDKFELCLIFLDEYEELLNHYLKKQRIYEEEDSFIKLIYFFHVVFQKLKITDRKFSNSISELKPKPSFSVDNFRQSYSFFYNSIKSFYTADNEVRNEYLKKAVQHIKIINNKLFFKLAGSIKS